MEPALCQTKSMARLCLETTQVSHCLKWEAISPCFVAHGITFQDYSVNLRFVLLGVDWKLLDWTPVQDPQQENNDPGQLRPNNTSIWFYSLDKPTIAPCLAASAGVTSAKHPETKQLTIKPGSLSQDEAVSLQRSAQKTINTWTMTWWVDRCMTQALIGIPEQPVPRRPTQNAQESSSEELIKTPRFKLHSHNPLGSPLSLGAFYNSSQ